MRYIRHRGARLPHRAKKNPCCSSPHQRRPTGSPGGARSAPVTAPLTWYSIYGGLADRAAPRPRSRCTLVIRRRTYHVFPFPGPLGARRQHPGVKVGRRISIFTCTRPLARLYGRTRRRLPGGSFTGRLEGMEIGEDTKQNTNADRYGNSRQYQTGQGLAAAFQGELQAKPVHVSAPLAACAAPWLLDRRVP